MLRPVRASVGVLTIALGLAACAPNAVTTYEVAPQLGRPTQILVYDFAVSPNEVRIDEGLKAELSGPISTAERTDQELAVGHKVAYTIADKLVDEIRQMGLPAMRQFGAPRDYANTLVIEGQLVSINEGNEAERVAIGLGFGASSIEAHTQLYVARPTGLETLERFSTDVKSLPAPGMAETMGAGAVAGHIAASAVVSAGAQTIGQKFGSSPTAEAERTAKGIAQQLRGYFQTEGWIPQQ